MIGKISKGKSFNKCVKYILDQDKNAKLLDAQGVRLKNRGTIVQSFIVQAKLKPKLGISVCHISLSFSAQDKDKLSNEFLVKITRKYMQKMGIANTQYIVAQHFDKEHPHIHLCFNRVDNMGKTISDKNDRHRSVKICKELTEKYGLHIALGKEKVKEHRLKEPDKTKYEIYHAIKDTLSKSSNWNELKKQLTQQGIQTNFKYKGQTDEIQGVTFTKNDYSFNGSKVDRMFSYSKIDAQLREYNISKGHTQQQTDTIQLNKNQSSTIAGSIIEALGSMSTLQPHGDDYEEDQFRKRMSYEEKKRKQKNKFKRGL